MKKYLRKELIYFIILAFLVLVILLNFVLGSNIRRLGSGKVLLVEKDGLTQKLLNSHEESKKTHVIDYAIDSVNIFVYRMETLPDDDFVNITGTYDTKQYNNKRYYYYLGFEKTYTNEKSAIFEVKSHEIINYKYNKKEQFIIVEKTTSIQYKIASKSLDITLDPFIYENLLPTDELMDRDILKKNFPNLNRFLESIINEKASDSFYANLYNLKPVQSNIQEYAFVDRLTVQKRSMFISED